MIGIPVVAFAAFFWTADDRPEILIADNGRLVGVVEGGLRQLNRDRGSGFAARSWLENDGDVADQDNAAVRFQGPRDDWSRSFLGTKVAYRWDKRADTDELLSLCNKVDLLIAPNWETNGPGSCILVDKAALKLGGHTVLKSPKKACLYKRHGVCPVTESGTENGETENAACSEQTALQVNARSSDCFRKAAVSMFGSNRPVSPEL